MARPTLEEFLNAKKIELGRDLTDEERLMTRAAYYEPERTRSNQRHLETTKERRYQLSASRGRWTSEKKAKRYKELLEKYGSDDEINEVI